MGERSRKGHLRPVPLGIAALLALAVSPSFALTPVSSCGQTLHTAGGYVLTGNLVCTGTLANGINITASNVTFHLAGYTIVNAIPSADCNSSQTIIGISVEGGLTNVVVEGGTVSGFNDGIVLGSSNSVVRGITTRGACFVGMAVQGQNNRVETSVVTANRGDGIGLGSASGAHIIANDISGNFRVGVDIGNVSDGNFVTNNIINNNGITAGTGGGVAIFNGKNNIVNGNTVNNNFDGILIESPENQVEGNTVNGSKGNGTNGVGIAISPDGVPSVVRSNTVLGSTFADMSDANVKCGGDSWTNDTFQTASVAGGPNPGLSGCIQ